MTALFWVISTNTSLFDLVFDVVNEGTPPRSATDTTSSPDITPSLTLLPSCFDWLTLLSIIVKLQKTVNKIDSECSTFTNCNKADWIGFREHYRRGNLRIYDDQGTFTRKGFLETLSNFPSNAAALLDKRDQSHVTDPNNFRIQQLTHRISTIVNEHKRTKWHQHLESCNSKQIYSVVYELRPIPNKQTKARGTQSE